MGNSSQKEPQPTQVVLAYTYQQGNQRTEVSFSEPRSIVQRQNEINELVKRATDLSAEAVEQDKNRHYVEAEALYYQSVALYQQALRGLAEYLTIKERCTQHLDRAEKLHTIRTNENGDDKDKSHKRFDENKTDKGTMLSSLADDCRGAEADVPESCKFEGDNVLHNDRRVEGASCLQTTKGHCDSKSMGTSEASCSQKPKSSGISLQIAVDLAIKAVEEDKNRNYPDALRFYERSVEYFLHALKYEAQSEKAKESIRAKCEQYLNRAEKVRDYLAKGKKNAVGGSNTVKNDETDSGSEYEDEGRKLAKKLAGAIITERPNVRFDDVVGLHRAKESLKEAVILPLKFPHLFIGKRKPYKSILLFGPQGTGKSYLANAIAGETIGCTFFSITSSDLMSKWQGESERSVKTLFALARQRKPSIIFIDEIDSLFGSDVENESTKRMKAEFMLRMQGMGVESDGVLVLGATNAPWRLDPDVRKRFEKKVYVGYPDASARTEMLKVHLEKTPYSLTEKEFKDLGERMEGYSGADINVVVKEALMQPLRKIQTATHFKRVKGPCRNDPSVIRTDLLTPCSPGAHEAIEMNWTEVDSDKLLEPAVTMHDMLSCLSLSTSQVKPNEDYLKRCEAFRTEFSYES